MSKFFRAITSLTGRFTSTTLALTLSVLIVITSLIPPDNEIQASGIAQGRVSRVKESTRLLDKVIKLKVNNINSPEFPKGFQVEVKNISSKPIYHIFIHVSLPDTEPFRTGGGIVFDLNFGHPKLVANSLRIEDITPSEREEFPLSPLEPGESCVLSIEDKIAEGWRKEIETKFGRDNPVIKNVELSIQVINFGDGTGYIIGRPYPNNRKISLTLPKQIPGQNVSNLKGFTDKFLLKDSLFSPKPISFLLPEATSFFYLKSSNLIAFI